MNISTDRLLRFTFDPLAVRGAHVVLDDTWRESTRRQRYPEPVAHLLGELLAAAGLVASTVKSEGRITLQAQGDGPLRVVMAECVERSGLRAIARLRGPDAGGQPGLPPDGGFADLLGAGTLAITITPAHGLPYQGQVLLQGESVVGAIEHYFDRSAQIPTRFWLACRGEQVRGLMLQRLPGGSDAEMPTAADEDAWRRMVMLASTLTTDELATTPAETLLFRLFHEETVRLHPPEPMSFHCTCSRQRTAAALRMMELAELRAIAAAESHVRVQCEFCGATWSWTDADLLELHADGAGPDAHGGGPSPG